MEIFSLEGPQVRLGREIFIYKDSSNRYIPFLWVNSKSAGQNLKVVPGNCG